MNTISDNDLILYFYKDGLDANRIAAIGRALSMDSTLLARYQALQRTLGTVDATKPTETDDGFTARIWRRLEARMDQAEGRRPGAIERLRLFLQVLLAPRFALAASAALALAIGVGYYAGRHSVSQDQRDNAMAARVLDAYVAEHLRATEGLLMTAVNTDSAELRAGNSDLAATLADSNRLYAAAAARSGNTRLAEFLRQLEPVLIELANQPADAPVEARDGLRDYLRKTDLLFQVRATQARIDTQNKPHRT